MGLSGVARLLDAFLARGVSGSTVICLVSIVSHLGEFDSAMDEVIDEPFGADLEGRCGSGNEAGRKRSREVMVSEASLGISVFTGKGVIDSVFVEFWDRPGLSPAIATGSPSPAPGPTSPSSRMSRRRSRAKISRAMSSRNSYSILPITPGGRGSPRWRWPATNPLRRLTRKRTVQEMENGSCSFLPVIDAEQSLSPVQPESGQESPVCTDPVI